MIMVCTNRKRCKLIFRTKLCCKTSQFSADNFSSNWSNQKTFRYIILLSYEYIVLIVDGQYLGASSFLILRSNLDLGCIFEVGYDYNGNDLRHSNGNLVKYAGISSAEECCEICQGNDNCIAFTFSLPNYSVYNNCWLKSSAAGRTPNQHCTSGTDPGK